MTGETLLFFSKAPNALALYAALEEKLLQALPDTQIKTSRTQISFVAKRMYGCVSLRGKKLVVSFGLPERLETARIAQAVEVRTNRWTHHAALERLQDVDDELLSWLVCAYDFAARK